MITVAYSDPLVPPEWIRAHGLRPRRLRAASVARSPSASLTGLCPYAGAFADRSAAPDLDAVIFTTACDQMRRVFEIAREAPRPAFLLNVPSTWQTRAVHAHYRSEIERLGRFLESLGGSSPTGEALAAEMLRYDERRRRLRDLAGRLSPRAFARVIARHHETGEVGGEDPGPTAGPGAVPLALVGGPLLLDDLFLFDLVEERGARVVLDGTDTGLRTLPAPYDRRLLGRDPFGQLLASWFGVIPTVHQRPNALLYRWLAERFAETPVKGILLRRYVWCDLWHVEEERLREWTGLPVLALDEGAEGRARERMVQRLEAFLEMLA